MFYQFWAFKQYGIFSKIKLYTQNITQVPLLWQNSQPLLDYFA